MIKAHIAISLDGYIAHLDGECIQIPEEIMKEISKTIESSDVLLAGFNTYQAIWERNGYWPLRNKTYVISHYDNSILNKDNLKFLFGAPIEKIEELRKNSSLTITVIGGGQLITSLINNKLLDELNLYILPVLLGEGIPLFGKTFDTDIKRMNSIDYKDSTKITYTFI